LIAKVAGPLTAAIARHVSFVQITCYISTGVQESSNLSCIVTITFY